MSSLFQFVILLLLITDLIMLWSGRILMLIRLSAVQGVLLAALLLLPVNGGLDAEHVFLAAAVFALKGVGFPVFLRHVCHKLGIEPMVRPRLGRMYPMAAGLAGLAFSLWLEGRIPAVVDLFPPLLFPWLSPRFSAASSSWWAAPRPSLRSRATSWWKTASSFSAFPS